MLVTLLLFELFFRHQAFGFFDSIFGIHTSKAMIEPDSIEITFDCIIVFTFRKIHIKQSTKIT